jgi:hypothetical protein
MTCDNPYESEDVAVSIRDGGIPLDGRYTTGSKSGRIFLVLVIE